MRFKTRLSTNLFWLLLIGVIFFFSILTGLILRREAGLISDIYVEQSAREANLIASDLKNHMLSEDVPTIAEQLKELNNRHSLDVGVVGPDGKPVFSTNLPVPEGIFRGRKEKTVSAGDSLTFYKPLFNERSCHACHNPAKTLLGMIVIKRSLAAMNAEIKDTARRILLFAFFLGIASEIFLLVILKKLVINPLNAIKNGAENLMSGRLDYRVDSTSSNEFGLVTDAFNNMAEKISLSHSSLERAVRQKTKELEIIAELSPEVFREDLDPKDITEQFLDAIVRRMGYRYAAIYFLDKETGLLVQQSIKGVEDGFLITETPLSSGHLIAEVARQAMPVVKDSKEVTLTESRGNIAIIPILSRQRRHCKDIMFCSYENCPTFDNYSERCWLAEGTLCRSSQAVAGKLKIDGCLRCDIFPVLGVLIVKLENHETGLPLHSLKVLALEIAAAIESQRLIQSQKKDIEDRIKLHDISVKKLQWLDRKELAAAITSSAADFANMDAAILWLKDKSGKFRFSDAHRIDSSLVPAELPVDDSFVKDSFRGQWPAESTEAQGIGFITGIISSYGFSYVCFAPLRFKGEIYGCLAMFKEKAFRMTNSEKTVILLFTGQAAAALNAADIYGRIKEEKEFSDAIFNNMSMGIMVLDEEMRIRKLNTAGSALLGLDDSAFGKRLEDVQPQADDFLVPAQKIGREMEITRGESVVSIGYSNSSLFDMFGNRTGTVVVFRDITEIKKLQAEMRKKQHFETMGKVIAGVAHEIRNPLFGISSLIQILEREEQTPEKEALLKAMSKETRRMKNLIEELLLYSRPSKLNMTDIELDVFMDKIERYIRAKKEKDFLRLMIPPSVLIRGDQDKLTQVFLNLIDNGLNAGSRSIEISAVEDREKGTVVISLKDDGRGIKKEDLDKIFDPFYTTRKEGTGLGLAICKKLVEDHKGTIEIQSDWGKGTLVQLTFPALGG